MQVAEQAADTFHGVHGRAPDGVWSAPGRVNLIGEHTDYNDGLVLPFALPQRVAAAAAARSDGILTVATLGGDGAVQTAEPCAIADLAPGSVTGWPAYVAGVAWVLHGHGIAPRGADIVLATDLPSGAGLSSSAAVECATALALLDLARVTRTPAEVAEIAQRAENDFVGVPCGILDQTAAMRCTAGHALCLDVASGEIRQVPFGAAEHGLDVVVIDTRVSHALADSEYARRRQACEHAAAQLGLSTLRELTPHDLDDAARKLRVEFLPLVRHVVTENDRVQHVVDALDDDRPATIGPLLDASHDSLRDDYRVSCPELDLAVDTARKAGAIGARMTGGGFGGSAIALVENAQRERLTASVIDAFTGAGLPAPHIFATTPSEGARRDR